MNNQDITKTVQSVADAANWLQSKEQEAQELSTKLASFQQLAADTEAEFKDAYVSVKQAIATTKGERLAMTRPIDGLKAALMEPEKKLNAAKAQAKSKADAWAAEKARIQRLKEAEEAAQRALDNEQNNATSILYHLKTP